MTASPSGTNTLPPPLPRRALAILRRKAVWIPLAAAGAAVVAMAAYLSMSGGSKLLGGQQSTGKVTRGALSVTVNESGEIEADRSTVIQNELKWPVIIKSVVPDGTVVQKGDKVIEFECKELSDAIEMAKIELSTAEAAFTKADQDLQLKTKELAHKVGQAKRDLTDAQDDKKRYIEGDLPVLRWENQANADVIKQKLNIARGELDFMKEVNKDPALNHPYSDRDIETKQLEVDQQQNALQKAEKEMEVLEKYTAPREVRKGEDTVTQKQLDLDRAELEQKTLLEAMRVDLQAKENQFRLRQKALNDMLEDQKKLTVLAERAGLIVYDTGKNIFSNEVIEVEAGQKVGLRQRLMIIPDMTTLQVRTKVFEAVVEQVREGLEAYVRLDARPDVVLKGKVKKVAPLPDKSRSFFDSGVKAYNVVVAMDELPAGLKPGMTTKVELILARLDNVLKAPVAAIFTEQEKTFCYRLRHGGTEKTPVKVGRMNDSEIEIISGVREGDEVTLRQPSDQGKQQEAAKGTAPGLDGGKEGGGK